MPKRYYLHKIYILLTEAVSDENLCIFCYDQLGFKLIYDQLTGDVGKEDLIDYLMRVAQERAALETILAWIEKKHPEGYQKYLPYAFTVDVGEEAVVQAPYRGLFAFREEDASVFFGRESFTKPLVEAVKNQPLTAVIGPSGSGKSSVIFAGLVPYLRREAGWLMTHFRPGSEPFKALAAALLPLYDTTDRTPTDRLIETGKLADALGQPALSLSSVINQIHQSSSSASRLFLIVDQFEELYTLCPEVEIRQRFLDVLLAGLATLKTEVLLPLSLVLSLRADFLGQALAYRPFADALQNTDVKLGPMVAEELRQAVEKPAQRQGIVFEPGLVNRILADVGNRPGNLPLLEFALTQLWNQQTRGQLTHVAYEAAGRVVGALTHYADEIYNQLSSTEQSQARRIFTQTVRPGKGTEDTRRLATLTELGETDWPLVQKLADARLVVTDRAANNQETIEVVHEALIQHWELLQDWMKADGKFRAWQDESLRADLKQWQETDRDEGALLRGAPLALAAEQLVERPMDLNQSEKDYINASLAQQRKQEQRSKLILAGAIIVAMIMAFLALFSWSQSQEVGKQARIARTRQLIAQGQVEFEDRPLLGLRLVLEALALIPANDQATQTSIRDSIPNEIINSGRLVKLGDTIIEQIYLSPDEATTWFVVTYVDGTSELRRTTDGSLVETLAGQISSLTFSPDEAAIWFVVTYVDAPVELRRTADRSLVKTLAGQISSVTFSPDEAATWFVVTYADSTVELRRTADGSLIETLAGQISSLTFSPDEAATWFVVTYLDSPVELRRTADRSVVKTPAGQISSVTFSPDEAATRFVVTYADSTVELRRTADGSLIETLARQDVFGVSVTFSPDEAATWFVVNYGYGIGELRRTTDGSLVETLAGQISSLTFSPDEAATWFVVTYVDGTSELRRTTDGSVVETLAGQISSLTFSPDEAATWFVVTYGDGTSELRRAADGSLIETLARQDVIGVSLTFSPDEAATWFIVNYAGGTSELRRTTDGSLVETLAGQISSLTFSPDEAATWFVVAYFDAPGELRRTTDGSVVETLAAQISSLTFSPDEAATWFVVTYTNGLSDLWQVQDHPALLVRLGPILKGYVFAVNQHRLITYYMDGQAYELDVDWLQAVSGDEIELSPQKLIQLACQGPFASRLFDEADLEPYLYGEAPKACVKP